MILARLLSRIYKKKSGIILIDSEGQKYICGKPDLNKPITVKLLNKNLNWKIVLNPDLNFPEAYMRGEIRFENGTLLDFCNMAFENIGRKEINIYGYIFKKILHSWRFITNYNLPTKSKKDIQYHYDIGEDLYDLFLDTKHRQYSCAYFSSENDSLEDAQQNKIDHIIKKLNLKPNQKVLDIGSGWGTLAIEIAKKSQCEVLGITLSENQYTHSVEKVKMSGLENQVRFKIADYRDLNEKFDRIVSVGMFEHVGRKFYNTYFKKVSNLLNEDGVALIHTIGSIEPPRDPHPWISKYIFPGGYTPSLSEIIPSIEKSGLIISDMEVLRMHYSHTLRNWKERFIGKKEKVLSMFDEKFFRMWEFYLAGCEMAFKWGDQVVFQFQLSKKLTSVPNTRDYIY